MHIWQLHTATSGAAMPPLILLALAFSRPRSGKNANMSLRSLKALYEYKERCDLLSMRHYSRRYSVTEGDGLTFWDIFSTSHPLSTIRK
jgi:hypothetical protein